MTRLMHQPRRGPACTASLLMLLALAVVPSGARAQDVPELTRSLAGSWVGEGELLGRPGDFAMTWEVREGGFLRLSFRNGWTGADGSVTPILAAEAVYHWRGDSGLGVWMDDRPQQLTLETAVTDSSMVVHWNAASESGRTEYILEGGGVRVVDVVFVDGGERPFAEAVYRRR